MPQGDIPHREDRPPAMFIHPPEGSREGKLFGLFFLMFVIGLGSLAIYAAYRIVLSYHWPAVPCAILASTVRENGGEKPYSFQVRYRYSWGGQRFEGGTLRRDFHATSDLAEVERLARAYPANARRTCYVNPARPSEAILVH